MSSPLEQKVTGLPGVGARRAALLAKLGLEKLGDFLTFFPRAYEDRTVFTTIFSAIDGQRVCVKAVAAATPVTSNVRKGLSLTKLRVFDETGAMNVTFFNNPYIKNRLAAGREYIFYGQIEARGGQKQMVNPVFDDAQAGEAPTQTGRILPVYRLTKGVFPKMLLSGVRAALEAARPLWGEPLPPQILERHGLCSQQQAYEWIHFPRDFQDVERARTRLVFEELFIFCLAGARLKCQNNEKPGVKLDGRFLSELSLAHTPTGAQARAIEQIAKDMASGVRMNRILQGDVGSGKTLVAMAAAFLAVKNGYQAAIMAPTELLANQHFAAFEEFFAPLGIRCACLTSSVTPAKKREMKELVSSGGIDVLVGTHAIIRADVSFKRAALFVADEQHRFGVAQRAALRDKANDAHLLVMSATPIPRTLSLIIYGDLDLSVLDELPPGRTPVQTFADGEGRRQRIYKFLEKQVLDGGQAYIVCPAIEEGGQSERTAAQSYADSLKKRLPDLRIGLMHSRLKAAEKESVMAGFAAGQLDVLVSTTVIEVGVNVPNASLMIVEDADSFGLSQLHQLRGRVGRGTRQSYCILMSRDPGETARSRLKALCATNDGFKIAEQDLKLRGPGDFFGNQQHGLPGFKVADLASDMGVLRDALRDAQRLISSGELEKYPALLSRVDKIIEDRTGSLN